MGMSFKFLSQAFEMDQQAYSAGLNQAISFTGDTYEAIGEYFAEQPRKDLDPIMDLFALYQGHLANYPDIIHVQKGKVMTLSDTENTRVTDVFMFLYQISFTGTSQEPKYHFDFVNF